MLRRAVVSIAMVGLMLGSLPALAAERWTGTSTAQDSDSRLQQIRWIGRIAGDRLEVTQNGRSVACATPRTAQLRRC